MDEAVKRKKNFFNIKIGFQTVLLNLSEVVCL